MDVDVKEGGLLADYTVDPLKAASVSFCHKFPSLEISL